MITLGTYYISRENVKAMAKVMRASTSNIAALAEFFVSMAGPYASAIALATALSANAANRNEVLYAADHNMRIRVVIKDAEVHTSYSTVVEFTAVN
ncbi:hypothetical protein BFT35_04955 [Thermoanaerobacterium thermosaccharolyticum]|uniref:hypothetical protein n=1 Tax=Thermoanaerobacterium thermosaccharolyticum TaxID=1517 RepID=UPI000C0695CD|nr:hypothetical protein [Thermoanaerobacterium thermosaccharolyticum]PHO07619.1 hypothetical protein BFT35_04955 [Thermoanaerobacterium thermosaccharolyticum]